MVVGLSIVGDRKVLLGTEGNNFMKILNHSNCPLVSIEVTMVHKIDIV